MKQPECPLCGATHQDDAGRLAHLLVAHGPLAAPIHRGKKRRRARAILPRLHRRLEEMGFDEAQAHLIVQAVAEELRKAGMV